MAFLISGRIFGLICLIIITAAVSYYIKQAQAGNVPKLRRIPGVEAIDEAIGRAVEMGRPVFCSHGIADLQAATTGPQTIAGLSVLQYVAKKSIQLGADLTVPVRRPEVWPIAADIVETEFKLAGRGDEFNPDKIAFLSSNQFSFSSSYMGMMMRDKPAANIMVGAYWAESLQLAETGARIGAMQIAGTAQTSQIPFFLVTTDYCLIGEEVYSVGAYLSEDKLLIGSLAGQDVGRILAVVLGLLGAIVTAMGSNVMMNLFRM